MASSSSTAASMPMKSAGFRTLLAGMALQGAMAMHAGLYAYAWQQDLSGFLEDRDVQSASMVLHDPRQAALRSPPPPRSEARRVARAMRRASRGQTSS